METVSADLPCVVEAEQFVSFPVEDVQGFRRCRPSGPRGVTAASGPPPASRRRIAPRKPSL